MTLDYKKMFLIVTEEAVVKGHFASGCPDRQLVTDRFPDIGSAYPDSVLLTELGIFYFLFSKCMV